MGGKKKAKGGKDARNDGGVAEGETGATEGGVGGVSGGKKSRRKKKEFDYDEELAELTNELDLDNKEPTTTGTATASEFTQESKLTPKSETTPSNSETTPCTSESPTTSQTALSTLSAHSSAVADDGSSMDQQDPVGAHMTKKSKKKKKKAAAVSVLEEGLEEVIHDTAGQEEGPGRSEGVSNTDREDDKKKKKKKKKTEEERLSTEGLVDAVATIEQKSMEEGTETTEDGGGVAGRAEDGEEEGATQDEDKKKKKKKKKKEEDKKTSKGPGKSAISKIKKMQAALEEEKLRREREALEALRAEEEREKARLEKLRLEKERKERQKQKEKDRKQRRKQEGKPVTKKEKEAENRRLAQLAALEEQGILIPDKGMVATTEKKKFVYASRQRSKKPGADMQTSVEDQSVEEEEEEEEGEGEGLEQGMEETHDGANQQGVESWEDLEDTTGQQGVESWEDLEDSAKEEVESWEDLDKGPVNNLDEVGKAGRWSTSDRDEGDLSDVAGGHEQQRCHDDHEEEESSDSSSDEEEECGDLSVSERARLRIQRRRERHEAERSVDTLRSPVVCVLGHVDTGKTKILDKIRRTNVQDGEAGGITQQIGATFVPVEAIKEQTKMLKEFSKTELQLPGLLIIDTPGHESFSNLRTRGSSMCDLAILVVDIMHGLEAQTKESLNLLKRGNVPFIVALNKVDRLYDWHRNPASSIRETLKKQKQPTRDQLDGRVKEVTREFNEEGLNVAMFWEKVDFKEYLPMVPTSAITGDGMGDLIALLVQHSVKNLVNKLRLSMEVEALVMEVKVVAGLGTTIDVILRNGLLREGDVMVLSGSEGPFVATIRALLMPQPLRELRVKNAYVSHSAVMAAQGIKVTAKGDLEKTLPGTNILIAKRTDEVEVLKEEAAVAMKNVLNAIKLQDRGVYVQASTLGSLEALLEFLKQSKIPYSGINIGPVHKRDVMKASVMLEHDSQWAVILAFDVRIERDAQEMADGLGVKIFSADIIYHLFDAFLKHREELRERNRQLYRSIAVFPCRLRILPNCIFNSRDPIVIGVIVEAGIVKSGTPLTVPSKGFTDIGVVTSLEVNHKSVDSVRKGTEVCLKIEPVGGEAPRLYGRHFDHTDVLVSKVSRESIDAVKNYFREDMNKSDWQLIIELKKMFQIM